MERPIFRRSMGAFQFLRLTGLNSGLAVLRIRRDGIQRSLKRNVFLLAVSTFLGVSLTVALQSGHRISPQTISEIRLLICGFCSIFVGLTGLVLHHSYQLKILKKEIFGMIFRRAIFESVNGLMSSRRTRKSIPRDASQIPVNMLKDRTVPSEQTVPSEHEHLLNITKIKWYQTCNKPCGSTNNIYDVKRALVSELENIFRIIRMSEEILKDHSTDFQIESTVSKASLFSSINPDNDEHSMNLEAVIDNRDFIPGGSYASSFRSPTQHICNCPRKILQNKGKELLPDGFEWASPNKITESQISVCPCHLLQEKFDGELSMYPKSPDKFKLNPLIETSMTNSKWVCSECM